MSDNDREQLEAIKERIRKSNERRKAVGLGEWTNEPARLPDEKACLPDYLQSEVHQRAAADALEQTLQKCREYLQQRPVDAVEQWFSTTYRLEGADGDTENSQHITVSCVYKSLKASTWDDAFVDSVQENRESLLDFLVINERKFNCTDDGVFEVLGPRTIVQTAAGPTNASVIARFNEGETPVIPASSEDHSWAFELVSKAWSKSQELSNSAEPDLNG